MERIRPRTSLQGVPCGTVAVSCAVGRDVPVLAGTRPDGYLPLKEANKAIRGMLPVKKYTYYKRGMRPSLRELPVERAIACCFGHYVYVEDGKYYSFFENENDKVVAFWELESA